MLNRRSLILAGSAALAAPAISLAQASRLCFAVGPFQPSPSDTRKTFEPFFRHLAERLGRPYDLVVTNDWAGISVALANGQADIAWTELRE